MLTLRQIRKIYEEGIYVCFSRKKVNPKLKGEYDPEKTKIIIYAKSIESRFDEDITFLHECIHARDDARGTRYLGNEEDLVEKEALDTYYNRPNVLVFLKYLFNIK